MVKLTKTGKYHISHKQINELKNLDGPQGQFKPTGFWYSIGSSWLDFKVNQAFNEDGIKRKGSNYRLNKTKHLYKLKFYNKKYTSTPNKDKVILLDTLPKIIKFNKKYMTV